MTDFVAYYRVSTQRQGQSGLGLDAQRAAVEAYALDHGSIIAMFTEIESGRKSKRPELEKALTWARQKGATLIVAKLDRLARDAAFVLGLHSAKVEFVAADMPSANRMVIGVMALVAEYEAEQISARTKAALAAAAARGVVLGGWRGSGTQKGRDTMLANAKARRDRIAPIVRAALDFEEGNLNGAARRLNGANVPTPSGRGIWHARQVQKYLERGEVN